MVNGSVHKHIINNTAIDFTVTLYIRQGDNIDGRDWGNVCVDIEAGQVLEVEYGNMQNGYLNALGLAAQIDGSEVRWMQRVLAKDGTLDIFLNKGDTLLLGELQYIKTLD